MCNGSHGGSVVGIRGGGARSATGAVHRLGPQRNPAIDAAVLDAARELLIERGYQGTSIDAIAARAGVGRPTIYRRWRTKAHIIHDAVYPTIEPTPLDPAEITEHVAALVAGAYALFGTPAARAGVPGLMSDTRSDPELRKRLVTEQLGPVREVVGGLIADASATGAIRPGVDVDTIVDVLAGAAIFALSVRDAELTDDLVEQMTELIVHGIMPGD